MATTSISLSAPPLLPIFKPRLNNFSLGVHYLSPPITSTFSLSAQIPERTRTIQFRNQIRRITATPEEALSSVTNPDEDSLQIMSSTSDGTATIIQVLLFISFAVLSVLTIGVIYLAVTDFLQKRESEKFEKEETAKNKKGGKKKKVRARAGPKGFGQKINDDDYQDLD